MSGERPEPDPFSWKKHAPGWISLAVVILIALVGWVMRFPQAVIHLSAEATHLRRDVDRNREDLGDQEEALRRLDTRMDAALDRLGARMDEFYRVQLKICGAVGCDKE